MMERRAEDAIAGRTSRWSDPTNNRTQNAARRDDESDGPAADTAAPVAKRRAARASRSGRQHVRRRGRGVGRELMRERGPTTGQRPPAARTRRTTIRSPATIGVLARDVRRGTHQPENFRKVW